MRDTRLHSAARRASPLIALALLVALGACSRPGDAPPRAADLTMRAQALIDSGNASYRLGDFPGAAKRYASATLVDPADPAAFYGLGMALSKLGRDDDARKAYAKARELARGSDAPADSFPH